MKLIASSATEQGLIDLAKKFWYSENLEIRGDQMWNTKLNKIVGRVEIKKNRYKLYI